MWSLYMRHTHRHGGLSYQPRLAKPPLPPNHLILLSFSCAVLVINYLVRFSTYSHYILSCYMHFAFLNFFWHFSLNKLTSTVGLCCHCVFFSNFHLFSLFCHLCWLVLNGLLLHSSHVARCNEWVYMKGSSHG